jgi:ligand-binding SRPBCC domain-containing protein
MAITLDPAIRFRALGGGEHELVTVTLLPHPVATVFPFFADAGNLARITPPELGFRILTPTPVAMGEGTLIDYRLRLFGIPFGWRTRITRWDPPRSFADEQLRGPYALWHHTHAFEAVPVPSGGDGAAHGTTRMTDRVCFRLPLGILGAPALPLVKLQLRRIFSYRGRAIREHLPEPGRQGRSD